MTDSTAAPPPPSDEEVVDWTDLGREMWSFLTGRQAAINYRFIDMAVEVPRDTGAEAPRATWKLNGTLQVTTKDNAGSDRAASGQVTEHGHRYWLSVDADLEFSVDIPGSRTVDGTPDRRRQALELRVSDPFVFAGRSDAAAIRGLADGLADARTVASRVVTPPGPLVALGAHQDLLAAAQADGLATHPGRAWSGALVAAPWSGAGAARGRAADRRARATAHAVPGRARPSAGVAGDASPRRTIPTAAGNPRLVVAARAVPARRRPPAGVPAARRRHDHRLRVQTATSGCRGSSRCTPRSGTTMPTSSSWCGWRTPARSASTEPRSTPAMLRTGTGVDLGDWHLSYYPRGVCRPRPALRRSDRRRARAPAPAAAAGRHRPGHRRGPADDWRTAARPCRGRVRVRRPAALPGAGRRRPRGPGHDPPSRHLQRRG